MKFEPDAFGMAGLARVRREPWSGVRNHQARYFVLSERKMGTLSVMNDRASRMSAHETPSWKPAVHDRQDAYLPAKLTVLGSLPAAIHPFLSRVN